MLEKKIRRYKLMEKHMEFVRCGKYMQAREIMWLLRKGNVRLGFRDYEWEVERFCEDIGCRINYGRNYNVANVIL